MLQIMSVDFRQDLQHLLRVLVLLLGMNGTRVIFLSYVYSDEAVNVHCGVSYVE